MAGVTSDQLAGGGGRERSPRGFGAAAGDVAALAAGRPRFLAGVVPSGAAGFLVRGARLRGGLAALAAVGATGGVSVLVLVRCRRRTFTGAGCGTGVAAMVVNIHTMFGCAAAVCSMPCM